MSHAPLQWSFLRNKKGTGFGSKAVAPVECFLHSATQVGNKIIYYGGADVNGEPQSQLYVYDTYKQLWNSPTTPVNISITSSTIAQSPHDHESAGARYGHTSILVGMHPPKIMIWGGVISSAGTFEFDSPNDMDTDDLHKGILGSSVMNWRRKGKQKKYIEELDDAVYFLELNDSDKGWQWSKPFVHGNIQNRPTPRAQHSACKISANEVLIFGGWTDTEPMNDVWIFNTVDMIWKKQVTSGIQPKPRYRHTSEVLNHKVYILGGSDNVSDIAQDSNYLNISELDLETMQWSHPVLSGNASTVIFPRSGHSSTVISAKIIAVFGGKLSQQTYYNDLILIDVSTYTCIKVDCLSTSMPTPITNATISSVGNKVYVFGGTDSNNYCYDGIRELNIVEYLSSDDIKVAQGLASDYSFKILIIGDAAVGKSAILSRFTENAFMPSYTTTLGIDFTSRLIRVDKAICKLEIWDTAGQERFATITSNYYRGAQGCLVVYDVSDESSFENAAKWYDRAKQLGGENLISLLIGNKTDLPLEERQVSIEQGFSMANKLGIPFIETSALNGSNIEQAFVSMTSKIKSNVDSRGLTGIKNSKSLTQRGFVEMASSDKKKSSCGCT